MTKKEKKRLLTQKKRLQRFRDKFQKPSQARFRQLRQYLQKDNTKKIAQRKKYEKRNEDRGTPLLCGVYGLINPQTKLIIYIGGSKDIHERFSQHIEAIKLGVHEDKMMRWFSLHQILPELTVLEECKQEDLTQCETSWIRLGVEEHWELLNSLDHSTCHRDYEYEKMRVLCKKLLRDVLGRS